MGDGMGDKIKGGAKEAAGKAQEGFGKMTDQPEHEAEGQAKQVEGKGDKFKGNVKETVDDLK